MLCYVYIIQSCLDNSYYKGFTEDPLCRLVQHNNGESHYTSFNTPWELVYVEVFNTKKDALIREKNIKKASGNRIQQIISSYKKYLEQFS